MTTGTAMNDAATSRDILRLAAWLSPAFPVGAYTYSSGLEYAVERGLVADAPMLERWVTDVIRFGLG
ncbi:MAG: urease accessory protein UreF, partial [Pseudomonadota bacterium]|nr:urease accessory protein UreF [Pseudomonadota bacterium]